MGQPSPFPLELSVLVPCYNEEGNLPELVERTERVFDRRGITGEIVLVNDGSLDGTGAQIDALATSHPCVVAVHHATNRGIPAGWKSAFDHSRGRYVCTIDADLQYQPEAIAQLYREMCFSRADLVQGWRSSLERHQYDLRYYMSRGLDHLLKLAFAIQGHDVKSGFVIYRRDVFEEILQHARGYHYFQHLITVVAKAKGYSIRQVETLFEERRAGRSFIGRLPLRMIVRTLVDIVRAVAEFRLREPKDQSLALALGTEPARPLPAMSPWRQRYAAAYRALMPAHHTMISHNAPRYLDELRRTQWLPPAEIEQLQVRRLRRLLQHAFDRVGYYREIFQTAGLVPDDLRTLEDLRRLPVLDKHALRENMYFDLLAENADKRKIRKLVTTGPTGEPLAVFADRFQLDMRWANDIRNVEWTRYRFPDRQVRLCQSNLDLNRTDVLKQRFDALMSRRKLFFSDFALRESELRRCLEHVRRHGPALLDGFCEALSVAAAFAAADGGEGLRAGAVVSYSQTLSPETRTLIEQQLGPVFDAYGSREFGTIAHECEAHGGLHVNAESYIVEILRDGRPAAEGEVGEVLITDLNNRGVPLLRYRLGDLAVATTRRCPCGRGLPLVERVGGRPPAVVQGTDGRYVPGTFFAYVFQDYEYGVRRYQVVQERPDRIALRIVRKSRFTSDTREQIERVLARVLGPGMSLHFEFVDAIPGAGDGATTCVCRVPLPLLRTEAALACEEAARREAAR